MNLKTKISTTLYLVVVLVSGISVSGYMFGSESFAGTTNNDCGRGMDNPLSGTNANGGESIVSRDDTDGTDGAAGENAGDFGIGGAGEPGTAGQNKIVTSPSANATFGSASGDGGAGIGCIIK